MFWKITHKKIILHVIKALRIKMCSALLQYCKQSKYLMVGEQLRNLKPTQLMSFYVVIKNSVFKDYHKTPKTVVLWFQLKTRHTVVYMWYKSSSVKNNWAWKKISEERIPPSGCVWMMGLWVIILCFLRLCIFQNNISY